MLDGDVMDAKLGIAGLDVILERLEQVWQPIEEGELAAELAQQAVVQALESAGLDVRQDVQQVHLVSRDELVPAGSVVLWQGVALLPERLFVNAVVREQRALHV